MADADRTQPQGPLRPRTSQELRLDPSHPPLARRRHDRVLTGLGGGIADFLGYPAWTVRGVFVAGTVVSLGVVALVYLALSALVPAARS